MVCTKVARWVQLQAFYLVDAVAGQWVVWTVFVLAASLVALKVVGLADEWAEMMEYEGAVWMAAYLASFEVAQSVVYLAFLMADDWETLSVALSEFSEVENSASI